MSAILKCVTIGCPSSVLEEMMLTESIEWLEPFLRLACIEGDQAAARSEQELGVITIDPAPKVERSISVTISDPQRTDAGAVVIPIRWKAEGYRSFLSAFRGSVSLVPVSEESTIVGIEGIWHPPDGTHLDFSARLVARRAAEAGLHNLLTNLRIAVEEAASAPISF